MRHSYYTRGQWGERISGYLSKTVSQLEVATSGNARLPLLWFPQ